MPRFTSHRLVFAFAMACVVSGCGDEPRQAPIPTPSENPSANADGPWRYLPTLRDAVPPGVLVEPILEVATPDEARLHIVAAVFRPGAEPALRIEVWAFTMHNDKGVLQPEFDPQIVMRTDSGQAVPEGKNQLRLRIAAPHAQVQRPVGLAAPDPLALFHQLEALATTVRDADATPQSRVVALATLVRGLDNAIVLESSDLAPTIDALAAGAWQPTGVRDVSDRRKIIDIAGTPPRAIQVVRKGEGWAFGDVGP